MKFVNSDLASSDLVLSKVAAKYSTTSNFSNNYAYSPDSCMAQQYPNLNCGCKVTHREIIITHRSRPVVYTCVNGQAKVATLIDSSTWRTSVACHIVCEC